MTVDEQLEIEKKKDIEKILSQGLFDLGIFCETMGMGNYFTTEYFKSKRFNVTMEIRDNECGVSVLGVGEGMSHLLTIDTIQKAHDYIQVLTKHLTKEPVKEFKKELQKIQRNRYASRNNI